MMRSKQRGFLLNPFLFGGGGGGGGPISDFPVRRGVSTANNNTTTTTHSITSPAGTVVGDLLIVFIELVAATTLSSYTSGWTQAGYFTNGTGSRFGVFYKIAASASETFTLASGSSCTSASLMADFHSANNVAITATPFYSNSPSPNPPVLGMGGAAKNYKWVSAIGAQVTSVTSTGGHTDLAQHSGSTATVAIASTDLNATSHDPSAWSISPQKVVYAVTLALWYA